MIVVNVVDSGNIIDDEMFNNGMRAAIIWDDGSKSFYETRRVANSEIKRELENESSQLSYRLNVFKLTSNKKVKEHTFKSIDRIKDVGSCYIQAGYVVTYDILQNNLIISRGNEFIEP